MTAQAKAEAIELQKQLMEALSKVAYDMGRDDGDMIAACINIMTSLCVQNGGSLEQVLNMVKATYVHQERIIRETIAAMEAGRPLPKQAVLRPYVIGGPPRRSRGDA